MSLEVLMLPVQQYNDCFRKFVDQMEVVRYLHHVMSGSVSLTDTSDLHALRCVF